MDPRRKIRRVRVMGDSLSDRGTLYVRKLFGFIPMSWLSGLLGKSPDKRFSNDKVWDDYLAERLAKKFDANDDVLNLDDDREIEYKGRDFFKTYAEGGLTSHHWLFTPLASIGAFFSRFILARLSEKRKELFADDKKEKVTDHDKKHTLFIEWSGANDLITVNDKPTEEEADLAVASRIKNARKMLKHGYQNIILNNLPDLSITPDFQKKTADERKEAHDICKKFNKKLEDEVGYLRKLYPHCNIDIFNVKSEFKSILKNPPRDLDPNKFKIAYVDSPDFVKPSDNAADKDTEQLAIGYTFWDGKHPTARMQDLLSEKIDQEIEKKYLVAKPKKNEVEAPINVDENDLINAFKRHYNKRFYKDKHFGFFGELCKSEIASIPRLNLTDIFEHALLNGGKRTYKVLQDMKWLDQEGKLNPVLNIKLLNEAYHDVSERKYGSVEARMARLLDN